MRMCVYLRIFLRSVLFSICSVTWTCWEHSCTRPVPRLFAVGTAHIRGTAPCPLLVLLALTADSAEVVVTQAVIACIRSRIFHPVSGVSVSVICGFPVPLPAFTAPAIVGVRLIL